jgi:hypothetical protein
VCALHCALVEPVAHAGRASRKMAER